MKSIFLFVFLLTISSISAQDSFTAKYFGLTIHPFGDRTAELQPYKFDSKARFVGNVGVFLGYDKFIYKDLISVKLIQGIFIDCSAGNAGFTHLGIRALAFENEKNRLYLGIGPTYIYRESWTRFEEIYNSSGWFNVSQTKNFGKIQHKFVWYGLDIEYDRILNEHNSLTFSCTPGVPLAIILSVGWKYRFKTEEFTYNRPVAPRK
jgi:hypothetical protein